MKSSSPENVLRVVGGTGAPHHTPAHGAGHAPGFGEALRHALEAGAAGTARDSSGTAKTAGSAAHGSAERPGTSHADGPETSHAEGTGTASRGVGGQRGSWPALVRSARKGADARPDELGDEPAGDRAEATGRSFARAGGRAPEDAARSGSGESRAAGRQLRALARARSGALEREPASEAASPGDPGTADAGSLGAAERHQVDDRVRGARRPPRTGSAHDQADVQREAAAGAAAAGAAAAGASKGATTLHGANGTTRGVAAALADAHARIASALATLSPRVPPSALAAPTKAAAAVEGHDREQRKVKEREPSRAPEALAAAPRHELPALAAPRQETPLPARLAASIPSPSADPALRASTPGQDVQGAVLRQAAHLKVEAGALGAVELHLRLRGDALHLRVDGDGARAVEARAAELSTALAGEGLKLSLEPPAQDAPGARTGGDGGRQGEERRQAWDEAADQRDRPATAPLPAPRRSTPTVSPDGVHVKA